jgi:Tol biopolymer transport system component/DNA-binding winged helix-turn-helix (wHTH) protein
MYEFGSFRVDADERKLLKNGHPVPLTPKAFEVLLLLVESSGHVVEKDELINRVWADSFVEEGNLKVTVSMLRKALDEDASQLQYIETVPRRGYRFIADVKPVPDVAEDLVVRELKRATVTIEEEQEPSISSAIAFIRTIRQHKKGILLSLVGLLVVLAAAGYGIYRLVIRSISAVPGQSMKIVKLTTTGKASKAAISPDGKYVAYRVQEDDGRESLSIQQVATGTTLQIVSPEHVIYDGETFSPDGNLIYYVVIGKDYPNGALYQVPAIGGVSQKLLTNVSGPITLSPDGKRLAFVRPEVEHGICNLIITNADGTGEYTLNSRNMGGWVVDGGPSWSPDGRTIAYGTGEGHPRREVIESTVLAIDAESGTAREITTQKWYAVSSVCWLRDGSGLLLVGIEQPGGRDQLWRVSYPDGKASRITNDLNRYDKKTIGVTRDSNTLVAAHFDVISSIWIMPTKGETGHARQITSASAGLDGSHGLSWTPDGRIIWSAVAGDSWNIWIMNADGSGRKQLTTEQGGDRFPVVTPDGRFILFESKRGGTTAHIWRMDVDGGNLKQLTDVEAYYPRPTPDGKWVVFQAGNGTAQRLWKVPMEGGAPLQLTDYVAQKPDISRDGRFIACAYLESQAKRLWRIGIVPIEGGRPLRSIDLPSSALQESYLRLFHWAPDGSAIVYVDAPDTAASVWSQPIDGAKPLQLTGIKTDYIFGFDISPDGKQLVCAVGGNPNDVVLISDFR